MGSGGSIAMAPGGGIGMDPDLLRESFDRNKHTLIALFFPSNDPNSTPEVEYSLDWLYDRTRMPLLCWLLEDIANERLKAIGDLKFMTNQSKNSCDSYYDLLDSPDIVSPIEVDIDQLESIGDDIQACQCTKYALFAECVGLSDLNFFDTVTKVEYPFNNTAVALNISNNQLNNAAFASCQLSQSRSLLHISMGGNSLNALPALPHSLLVLDLSYSEEIQFHSPGIFSQCPQLLKLVLDGCGLNSTMSTLLPSGEGNNTVSIFSGLVKLIELSLKENQFADVESLQGLQFFSKNFSSVGNDNPNAESSFTMALKSIRLADNPISENTALRKEVLAFVTTAIPSVCYIDGKSTVACDNVGVIDKSSAAYKQLHPVVTDNDMITETMAQEFASALKGEKDNAVVS